MGLKTPESAILSAVIFNALIIVALIPLALRGVEYRAMSAAALLRRNLLIYGLGGIIVPFIGIKIIDVIITMLLRSGMRKHHRQNLITAVLMTVVTTLLLGIVYPLVVTGLAKCCFPGQANGQLIERNGKMIGSRIIGQAFSSPGYFRSRPSAAGTGYDAANSAGTNLGPTNKKLIDAVKAAVDVAKKENPSLLTNRPRDVVRVRA